LFISVNSVQITQRNRRRRRRQRYSNQNETADFMEDTSTDDSHVKLIGNYV